MQHVKDRWAKTEMAPPYGIGALHDLQRPEAAHAASELDDWEPMPLRERWAAWAVLLGVPAAVIVLGIVVALVWARLTAAAPPTHQTATCATTRIGTTNPE